MIVLRALGALLTYPRPELIEALSDIDGVIAAWDGCEPAARQRLADLITELRGTDRYELEERYVEIFDRSRTTSMYLFEHVHGDSRERGPAMVDLKSLYERAGLSLASSELPDYLPAVLEYLSCRSLDEARDMLGDCAHVLRAIGQRLVARDSRYAAVFDVLLSIAAEQGLEWSVARPEPATGADERHVDEEWMDAPAFGGGSDAAPPCRSSSSGDNARRAAAEVPLHFMPRASRERR